MSNNEDGKKSDTILIEAPRSRGGDTQSMSTGSATTDGDQKQKRDPIKVSKPAHLCDERKAAAKAQEVAAACAIEDGPECGEGAMPSKDFYELSSVYISNTDPNQPVKVRLGTRTLWLNSTLCC